MTTKIETKETLETNLNLLEILKKSEKFQVKLSYAAYTQNRMNRDLNWLMDQSGRLRCGLCDRTPKWAYIISRGFAICLWCKVCYSEMLCEEKLGKNFYVMGRLEQC